MYLKRLEIYGFKSFGTKSILDFEANGRNKISAVVGPNGSGKSNIADAVRWVLGEQSGKLLRSKKNEDVIFVGSSTKSRSSYAEVSIILQGEKEVEVEINNKKYHFSEIEVSRKLYRSGESEYQINKKKVRLLDVQQLLATLGFGQSSYTVIGQGMVDRLLFFNAAERKVLFDEAAGVKQYEIKREQAIRKLQGTDTNLIRLSDILTELEPRVVNLRRLVKRAEGRKELEAEFSELQNTYYLSLEKELKKNISVFTEKKDDLNKKIVQFEKEIEKLDLEIDKTQKETNLVSELSEIEHQLNQATNERDTLMQEVIRVEALINQTLARSEGLNQEKSRLESEKLSIQNKIEFLTKKIAEETAALKNDQDELLKLNSEIESLENNKLKLDTKLSTVENDSETEGLKKLEHEAQLAEQKRREISNELFSLQQRVTNFESAEKERISKLEKIENEIKSNEEEIENKQATLKELEKQKKEKDEKENSAEKNVSTLIKKIEKIETDLKNVVSGLEQTEIELFDNDLAVIANDFNKIQGELSAGIEIKGSLPTFFKDLDRIFSKIKNLTKALNKTEREKFENELSTLRTNLREGENSLNKIRQEKQQLEFEITRVTDFIKRLEGELVELSSELSAISENKSQNINKKQIESLEKELATVNTSIEKLESEIREKSKSVSEKKHLLLAEKSKIHEEETEIRRKIYDINLLLSRKKITIENQERELTSTETKLSFTIKKLEELASEFVSANSTEADELKKKKNLLAEKNQLLVSLREKFSAQLAKQREEGQVTLDLERRRRSIEVDINNLRLELSRLELEEAKYSTRLEDLVEELRLTDVKLNRTKEVEILDQAARDQVRVKMENLRRRLETIGSVDPEIVAEYEELETRSSEMSKQVSDLQQAKDDLEKVIKELDTKIKRQFADVFTYIATEFNRYFQILFNGGKATLTLGEDEEGNYGIEIAANPPGKKIQSLNALSGGERTLTSLALVFAILSINPSPFCVLDEVDAALDEANTLRFSKILEDLDCKTQFIVISHNRETMKVASSLYGITMDSDHVSKMISIKLTEALETVA